MLQQVFNYVVKGCHHYVSELAELAEPTEPIQIARATVIQII